MPRIRPLFLCSWLTLSSAAIVVAPASAQRQIAPPGNSGVTQYLETVPGAGGNEAPRPRGEGSPKGARPLLGPRTRRALEGQGAEGRRLAELLESTAVSERRALPRRSRSDSPASVTAPDAVGDDRSALQAAADALLGRPDGEEGAGPLLPMVLIASTILLALLAARRRKA